MSSAPAKEIVWIDLEMTGLDIENDGICELAIVITDFNLKPLDDGFSVVINPGESALKNMNDFVRNMHDSSGLLPLIESGTPISDAEKQALEYVDRFVQKDRRPLVAGNTIGMDRRFIDKYMPTFDERMHYRSIDVSTVKELARRWFPKTYFEAPGKGAKHRALDDIIESIRELAYFKETVFVAEPGVASDQAKTKAAAVNELFAPFFK